MTDSKQRIIKFRAWDTEKTCWLNYDNHNLVWSIDGPSGYIELCDDDDGGKNGLHEHHVSYKDGRFVLEQFTGLQDKNGKDIFEGDIVLIEDYYTEPILDDGSGPQTRENHFGIVTFRDGMFGFLSDGKGDYFEKGFSSFETMAGQVGLEELEIIGNVHANPELLEVSNG